MTFCNKGTYYLLISCREETGITVGGLGKIIFSPGYYYYIGSALNNMDKRVSRHVRKKKKIFWHIDYITSSRDFYIEKIYTINDPARLECKKAGELGKILKVIQGFGSSDCRCEGHLFYTGSKKLVNDIEKEIIIKSGFKNFNTDIPEAYNRE